MKPIEMSPVARRFIEESGHITQALGSGRVVGQIYAYLFFSPIARNLSDLQTNLGISKGSASMGVRQLEQWGAVRKVWVKGDRKDYYEANDWFGRIIRSMIFDAVGQRLNAFGVMLQQLEADAAPAHDPDAAFVAQRLAHLRAFHGKAEKMWTSPILRTLLE